MMFVRFFVAMPLTVILLSAGSFTVGADSLAVAAIRAPAVIRDSPENEAVIVKLPDGKLRVFYTLQPSGTELRSITSGDGGLTWGDDRFEVTMPGRAVFCIQALVANDGELHAFVLVRRGEGRRYGIDLFLDVWHWRTTEGCTAWTSGERIFEGVVGALRGVTQLKSGRILLPVGMWLAGRKAGLPTGAHEVSAMYSDDNGATWQMSPSRLVAPCYEGYNGSNYGACEPNVVELEDNHVWMLMRTQTGSMYESHSYNGGTTWSDAQPSVFAASDSPAEILRLADDRLMVIWNNHQNPPRVDGKPVAGGRDALHAAISADNGRTWRGCREIYRDPLRNESPPRRGDRGTAYATAVMNDEGKVVVATGQGEHRRAILIFDPDWLLEERQDEDFSQGLDRWSAFTEFGDPEPPVFRDRALGPEVIGHPSKAGCHVLHIRRSSDRPGDGAVWNFPSAMTGKLALHLMLQEGFSGVHIALCDRFFNPTDSEGERHAVFGLPIDSSGTYLGHGPLEFGTWHLMEFCWDTAKEECAITLDRRALLTLPMLTPPKIGISYLRLRSIAEAPDSAGMLVERVSMERK
jgi:hypothetical protein